MNAILTGHPHVLPLPGAHRGRHAGGHPLLADAGKATLVNLLGVALIELTGGSGLHVVVHPVHLATLIVAALLIATFTVHLHASRAVHDYVLIGLTFMLQVGLAIAWNLSMLAWLR